MRQRIQKRRGVMMKKITRPT